MRPNSVIGLKESFELVYEGGMRNKTWNEMKGKTAGGGSARIQFGNFVTDSNYALVCFSVSVLSLCCAVCLISLIILTAKIKQQQSSREQTIPDTIAAMIQGDSLGESVDSNQQIKIQQINK